MRIELFQDLYAKYSNLALSFKADRPIAIRGLEKRLKMTFDTKGDFGIFDIYLHRCLIWQRANAKLKRIESFRAGKVPSWSWMAYDGGIKYMDIPGGKVDWAKDIVSPFANDSDVEPPTELRSPIYEIAASQQGDFIWDDADRTIKQPLKCIIVGTSKEFLPIDQSFFYLLVVEETSAKDPGVYERVGVARLRRDQVAFNGSGSVGSVQ
jgi:hypothetical protein